MNITKYIDLYRKDLELKNYATNSIENYISQVKTFLSDFDNIEADPSRISERQIKDWLLEARSINGRKHRISALKLFYKLSIKQPLKFKYIEYPKSDKKLPIVLSVEEIQKMFNFCENKKHKVILALLYSCGLRVSELVNLKWSHIDRSRMVINIIQAKGHKDRQVMLSPELIPLLEGYYKEYKSKEYVLNGQFGIQYSARSVGEVVKKLATIAGIKKRVYTHLMRHCSFTHMVENGTDLTLIQKMAGHANIKTTQIYTNISHNLISKIKSPLSGINFGTSKNQLTCPD